MEFDQKKMRSLMIDHIDGKITGELARYVELHIQKNAEAKAEYEELRSAIQIMDMDKEMEVPEKGKIEFMKMASEELQKQSRTNSRQIHPDFKRLYRVAAVLALIILGFAAGHWFSTGTKQELAIIQEELNKTKELVLMNMMKQGSASERLKGIVASREIENADEDIIDALVIAMNTDSNINVRIAAVEALTLFSENEKARASLIASLNRQNFPAVQLKLINVLVSLGDKNALEPMKEFSTKQDLIKAVQDEAHMGVFKLM